MAFKVEHELEGKRVCVCIRVRAHGCHLLARAPMHVAVHLGESLGQRVTRGHDEVHRRREPAQ